jgi:hypothetical protein
MNLAMQLRVASADELEHSDQLADAVAHIESAGAGAGLDATRRRMLAFAAAHPDALHRTCATGHFTGSALVLDPEREQMLLLHHTKLRRWLRPVGHSGGDGNLEGVARRVATEVAGVGGLRTMVPAIDLDVHLVEPPRERPHLHYDVRFLVLAPPGAPVTGNHESTSLRWVTVEDLPALGCDAGLQRMVHAGLAAYRASRGAR